jgi:hypothetical protein
VPAGPPSFWSTVDPKHYRLPSHGEERPFEALHPTGLAPVGRAFSRQAVATADEGSRPRCSRGTRIALDEARRVGDEHPPFLVLASAITDLGFAPPPRRPSAAYRNAIDDLLVWAERDRRASELFEDQAIVDYLDDYQRRFAPAPATYHVASSSFDA